MYYNSFNMFVHKQPLFQRCIIAHVSIFSWQMFRWGLHSSTSPINTFKALTRHAISLESKHSYVSHISKFKKIFFPLLPICGTHSQGNDPLNITILISSSQVSIFTYHSSPHIIHFLLSFFIHIIQLIQ